MSRNDHDVIRDRDFDEDDEFSEYDEQYGNSGFEKIQRSSKRMSEDKEFSGKKSRKDF